MKAVILAMEGGKGLWPVPVGGTALGAPVLGRSLLEWNALALKGAGVTQLVLALAEGAEAPALDALALSVRRFPADMEETAILSACAGGWTEDFFLLRAGLLWEGPLDGALEAHRTGAPAMTLVEFRAGGESAGPEAGRGRVLPFPARETAGLAVCSPALLPELERARDWAELLSRLRAAGELGTCTVPGPSGRVDSPAALLRAVAGLLSARRVEGEPIRPGIWSRSPVPENVELVPPCVIGAGVELGKGCLIGPHAVLEDGVRVAEHSLIQRSILCRGAQVGSRAAVYGGVVCERAVLGRYTVLNEGAAVGPDARVGDNAALMEGVGVGAGQTVPPSTRLTEDFPQPAVPAWTVEEMVRLGRRLGRCGAVGAGGAGYRGLLLARAFCCGAAAQGAAVVLHDGVLPRQAAWLAGYYGWPASLFADGEGQIYLLDARGQALTAPPPDGETGEGSWDLLAGTAAACAAAMEREDAPAQAVLRPCRKEFL